MTKDQTLAALGNQLDSFYSLQQVIDIVKNIEVGSSRKITTNDIEQAIDKVINWARYNEDELFDLSSAELEMSYDNRIEVVGVPINMESLRDALENNFMDFGEDETEDETKNEETTNNEL